MPVPDSAKLLGFALQQMAAESYLDEIDPEDVEQLRAALLRGNNRLLAEPTGTTRLTPEQAVAFIARYRIVDHHPNDGSGFSATVLFDTRSNRYTLAFRSTEYARRENGGDFERDAQGADFELADHGLALAQLASMEAYFAGLREGIGANGESSPALQALSAHLSGGGQINVTG